MVRKSVRPSSYREMSIELGQVRFRFVDQGEPYSFDAGRDHRHGHQWSFAAPLWPPMALGGGWAGVDWWGGAGWWWRSYGTQLSFDGSAEAAYRDAASNGHRGWAQ